MNAGNEQNIETHRSLTGGPPPANALPSRHASSDETSSSSGNSGVVGPIYRIIRVGLITIGIVALLILSVVLFTVFTPYSAEEVRLWFEAVGGVISAAAAVVVALFGFAAQRQTARETAESERKTAAEAGERALRQQMANFERQRALDHVRVIEQQQQQERALRLATWMEDSKYYQDLLGWALQYAAGKPEADYNMGAYARAMATSPETVKSAAKSFRASPPNMRQEAYERFENVVRREVEQLRKRMFQASGQDEKPAAGAPAFQ